MKTILLGYSNAKATGPAKVIAGPEVSIAEQIKLVTGIKARNEYPEGIERVEFCELVSRNVGIRLARPAAAESPKTETKIKPKK